MGRLCAACGSAFVALVWMTGCGGEAPPDATAGAGTRAAGVPSKLALPPDAPRFTVTGTVTFDGVPPTPQPRVRRDDPECDAAGPDTLLAEDVLVSPGGGLQNVFVSIQLGLEPDAFPPPVAPARMERRHCCFAPRVLGVQVGQPLQVRNADATVHTVRAVSRRGAFNAGLRPGRTVERTFREAEGMVQLRCDVHGGSIAWLGVVDHPFFAVTDAEGRFAISGLPAGTYTVEAWHERFGRRTGSVAVGDARAAGAGGDAGADAGVAGGRSGAAPGTVTLEFRFDAGTSPAP